MNCYDSLPFLNSLFFTSKSLILTIIKEPRIVYKEHLILTQFDY